MRDHIVLVAVCLEATRDRLVIAQSPVVTGFVLDGIVAVPGLC